MINKKKIQGIIISIIGILMVKIKTFVFLEEKTYIFFYLMGIFISCLGIAVFTSGLNRFIVEEIKICPKCFHKNKSTNKKCKRCKRIFYEE